MLLELETDAEMRDSEDEIASNVARVDVLSTQVFEGARLNETGEPSAVKYSSGSDTKSNGRE